MIDKYLNELFYRDCVVIISSNFVWTVLSLLLVFSLLGVTHNLQTINITNIAQDPGLLSITGDNIWLAGVTLLETALSSVSSGMNQSQQSINF